MISARKRLAIAAASVVAVLACSKDSNSSTGIDNGTGNDTSRTSTAGLNIAVDSGFADRTAVVGTQLLAKVHVTRVGVGVGGIQVIWTPIAGHGSASPDTVLTDTNGLATTTWTLGDTIALNVLNAGITGAQVTMQATAIAGAAASLKKISPDSAVVVSGASMLVTARAVDQFGNAVAGVPVTWSVVGGGVLSPTTTTTSPNGNAQVILTTDPQPGAYTVTATSPGLGSVSFKLVGL